MYRIAPRPLTPFEKSPAKRKGKGKTAAEKKHHGFVFGLPCCVCGARGVHVHHVTHCPNGGKNRQRRDHWHVVPLCPAHHNSSRDSIHQNDVGAAEWCRRKGVDLHALAAALAAVTGDHEAGLRAIAGATNDRLENHR